MRFENLKFWHCILSDFFLKLLKAGPGSLPLVYTWRAWEECLSRVSWAHPKGWTWHFTLQFFQIPAGLAEPTLASWVCCNHFLFFYRENRVAHNWNQERKTELGGLLQSIDGKIYWGALSFLRSFTPLLSGLEGSISMFLVFSRSKRVGYLILIFRAKWEMALLAGLGSVAQE